jgi:hypothetical protein
LKIVEFKFYKTKLAGQMKSAQTGKATQQLSCVTLVESKFYYSKPVGQTNPAQVGKATQQLS